MFFRDIVPSLRGVLSSSQALELTNVYLENAKQTKDHVIALVFCHDAEVALSRAKKFLKLAPTFSKNQEEQMTREGMAAAYLELGKQLENRGYRDEAQASYKRSEKLRPNGVLQVTIPPPPPPRPPPPQPPQPDSSTVKSVIRSPHAMIDPSNAESQSMRHGELVEIPSHFFAENIRPPTIPFRPPGDDERFSGTPQLACCIGLLQASFLPSGDILDPVARSWLQTIKDDPDEQERLRVLATDVVRVFKRDESKDPSAVTEVVHLAPVLDKDDFRYLLMELCTGIDNSILLDVHRLEGMARLIQGAHPGYLSADDLVKILNLLSTRLRETHNQSLDHMYKLTLTVSHVLDAMADTNVKDLNRKTLHEPLALYLEELKGSSDPYLVYQAAYACQALICVPDDETLWQETLRRTGKVFQGVAGLVSAVKGLDLNAFIHGLDNIQQGLAGATRVVHVVATAIEDVSKLTKSGQRFLDSLKESFSFQLKCVWYTALRGADTLIQEGHLAAFKELVYEAPCRKDPAFQIGVCQRLAEVAADSMWSLDTRRDAITFLGEIYRNDTVWGPQQSAKQWILSMLMQLSAVSGIETDADKLLKELKTDGDSEKQDVYQKCLENSHGLYPLKIPQQPTQPLSSLLDRVQKRPDVEGRLRLLRKHHLKDRVDGVYIPPRAKASLQAPDDARFPLMEKVKDFLDSDRTVFLLLGDSGSGKSTFNCELECELWQTYVKKTGVIPLHINLPAIDKPEHDMITKQLRKSEFTEPQIRELKLHRKFILICDGYDEGQQTHNLYTSNRLNMAGEWNAKMVISCRSEYLGSDYRDRFQPGDRNRQSDSELFQEAVLTPLSSDQVHDYIEQYVSIHRPLWEASDYKQALELIPSLKDLVKNPFLMALSLEVLPRMVDPGQQLSAARVTKVALYDQFLENWLDRGKIRLGEKDLTPQARAAFESLSAEGFTRNGIHFLKKLAMAIYKEQGGQPVVEYSRFVDEGSWKDTFFSREEEKQLLREACPLIRSGNQHRFIHRSLLEYGLSLAVFDPRDRRKDPSLESTLARRGSTSSVLSFEICRGTKEKIITKTEPDINSPLAWESFVNDPSILQFLKERVEQEPVFKQQLLAYIEHSKADVKWRTAAANAITILVRAGVHFVGADLNGIRIPGADISYGMFDSTQLQKADLRKANLRGVWMRQADLNGAQMTGTLFGELPLLREQNSVYLCAYSSDGKLFAAGLDDGEIRVYDTSSWSIAWTLGGVSRHIGTVWSIAFSPKHDQIASTGQDKTVRLWDLKTGHCIHVLSGHVDEVVSVAYSPNGDDIVSASYDKTMRLWNATTGDWCYTFANQSSAFSSVTYSPDGNHIASSSTDAMIRLWALESKACIRTLAGHTNRVSRVVYSPRGDMLASASSDMTLRVWDVETGTCLTVLTGHTNCVFGVAFSPRGDQIASGGKDGTVRLWDAETGALRHTLTGHVDSVFSVAYSPKGDQVASASTDKTVRLWHVEDDASHYVSSGHSMGVYCVQRSPSGELIATGSTDSTIRLWDAESGTCRRILHGHSRTVFCIAFSPQGTMIASASGDTTIRLWNVETGAWCSRLTGHTDWVRSIAYSPQGDAIVSAGNDMTVRLWDVGTESCRLEMSGHTEAVFSVAFSPKGDQVVSGGKDFTVRLWDTTTGECCRVLSGHQHWVRCVTYSPQGSHVASASDDTTVMIWNVETGVCSRIIDGHREGTVSVSYSPRGDVIATGSWDRSVKLWDVTSGLCRGVIKNFQDCIHAIVWSSSSDDANYLVTGCGDGSVVTWKVTEGEIKCSERLVWSATNGVLTVKGTLFQGVSGLSHLNRQLLKQRGARVDPIRQPEEGGRRLAAVTSVVPGLLPPPPPPGRARLVSPSATAQVFVGDVEVIDDK